MPKSKKSKPLYNPIDGRGPTFRESKQRGVINVAGPTHAMVRKMAEASGLPAGLIVHAAVVRFLRIPAKVRTAAALRLIGVG